MNSVDIPDKFCGGIICKGGSKIQELNCFDRMYVEISCAFSVVMIIRSSDNKAKEIINELMELDFSRQDLQNNLSLSNDSPGLIEFGSSSYKGLDSTFTDRFGKSSAFGSGSGGFGGSSGGGFGSSSSVGFGNAHSSELGTNSSSGFGNNSSGGSAGFGISCFRSSVTASSSIFVSCINCARIKQKSDIY